MIRSIVIFCFFFLTSAQYCISQMTSLEQVSYASYSNGSKIAKLHKFEEHFSGNKEQHRLFKKFNRTRLTLKIINFSSVAMIGATAIAVNSAAQKRNDSSVPVTTLIGVMGIIGTGQVVGLSNAILIPIKNRRKDKLLRYDSSSSSMFREEQSRLAFSFGEAGIGVAVNF